MTVSPELLHDEAVRRIRESRPDLARGLDLSTNSGLVAAQAEIIEDTEVMTVCVVRHFDLVSWIRGTCAYAAGLPADVLPAWRRSFTKAIFLAGNPENLLGRFSFDRVSEDGTVAWTAPAPESAFVALRRLLKLFDGPAELPAQPVLTVEVPRADGVAAVDRSPAHHGLYVATAGVTVAEVMVHLNHLLAEAVLDGSLAPGDALTVRQVPRLTGVSASFEAMRIGADADAGRPDRLRAFAGLTKET